MHPPRSGKHPGVLSICLCAATPQLGLSLGLCAQQLWPECSAAVSWEPNYPRPGMFPPAILRPYTLCVSLVWFELGGSLLCTFLLCTNLAALGLHALRKAGHTFAAPSLVPVSRLPASYVASSSPLFRYPSDVNLLRPCAHLCGVLAHCRLKAKLFQQAVSRPYRLHSGRVQASVCFEHEPSHG